MTIQILFWIDNPFFSVFYFIGWTAAIQIWFFKPLKKNQLTTTRPNELVIWYLHNQIDKSLFPYRIFRESTLHFKSVIFLKFGLFVEKKFIQHWFHILWNIHISTDYVELLWYTCVANVYATIVNYTKSTVTNINNTEQWQDITHKNG